MHSSRMRTARLLTVSQHALSRGGSLPGGCLLGGGVSAQGVADIPPVDRMTGLKTLPCRNFVAGGNKLQVLT